MSVLVCWRCGTSLKDFPQPLVRLAQCKACGADLHVCRLCKFYNPGHFEKCDHEMAEPAREVDVANFCHYFRAQPGAYNPQEKTRADDAMAELKALFGDTNNGENESRKSATDKTSDEAKAKFDALFKRDKD
ncbi:MAG: hypothetical protein GC149_10765 [Gammaproteobacteria bacterium]|nr:hypothetical protein [Gammaproteobacteria bacterium]